MYFGIKKRMGKPLSKETIEAVKQMALTGSTKKDICLKLNVSRNAVYVILTGKKNKPTAQQGMWIRGLNPAQRQTVNNIARNKDVSRNKLLLSYIKNGMNAELPQMKVYED